MRKSGSLYPRGLKQGRLPFNLYVDLRRWVLGFQTVRWENDRTQGHMRTVYLFLGPLSISIWRTVG